MKKITLFLSIIALMAQALYSQAPVDSIQIIGTGKDLKLMQGREELDFDGLMYAVRANPQAVQMVQSAKSSRVGANILGFVGGLGVGYTLGGLLFGNEPNWAVGGVGALAAIISFPISQGATNKARQAAELYNRGLRGTTGFIDQPNEIKVGVTGSGVGLVMGF